MSISFFTGGQRIVPNTKKILCKTKLFYFKFPSSKTQSEHLYSSDLVGRMPSITW